MLVKYKDHNRKPNAKDPNGITYRMSKDMYKNFKKSCGNEKEMLKEINETFGLSKKVVKIEVI